MNIDLKNKIDCNKPFFKELGKKVNNNNISENDIEIIEKFVTNYEESILIDKLINSSSI